MPPLPLSDDAPQNLQLQLVDLNLKEIDTSVTSQTTLTELFIQQNHVTVIPPEISQLANLTVLNLAYNRISEVPPEIAQLKHLKELILIGNKVSTWPNHDIMKTITTLEK